MARGGRFHTLDMAATPDGGVLILDAKHCRYWQLDENFRLLGDEAEGGEALFQPSEAGACCATRRRPR